MQLIDRLTLADVSPVQIIDSFEGGVWMVWQYRYDHHHNRRFTSAIVMHMQGRR